MDLVTFVKKLGEDLNNAGCRMIYADGCEKSEHFVMQGIFASGSITIEGLADRCLKIDFLHEFGEDGDAIQKIVDVTTGSMKSNPLLHATSSITDDCEASAEIADFATLILGNMADNIIHDHWIWCNSAPEQYLRRLLNDPRDKRYKNYLDGELFDGRQFSDYVDEGLTKRYVKAKEMHEDWEGVYGLDPANLDCPALEDSEIIMLYLAYQVSVQKLCEGSETSKLEQDYIKRCICEREHIAIKEPNADQRLEVGSDFQKWVAFYENHEKQCGPNWVGELIEAHKRGENLSRFYPAGNWRDSKSGKPAPKRKTKVVNK